MSEFFSSGSVVDDDGVHAYSMKIGVADQKRIPCIHVVAIVYAGHMRLCNVRL